MLEVSASDSNAQGFFREEREYKNVGLSRKGEPATAAWAISSYSREKSTAIRAHETRREIFTVSLAGKDGGEIVVRARIVSHHGLPVEFGKPMEGKVVLEKTQRVRVR